ncbi:MAG: C4-dicarboxylate transporter DctA [Acidobacteria bacterium RIFCSPLOWO2_12_FULL_66_21]|nr:MAG: C4-dicarboxylate transporter DctA [Acidobacteria bacterium RIFCSPLOWO2_12_FULL_66_21]
MTQVVIGIVAGIVLGYLYPHAGAAMKPLGDGFIKLIKMVIAPIIFVTVVGGLCRMSNLKEVGRIGVRALIYFEIASTLANFFGLGVGLLFRPGQGLNIDPATFDASAVSAYANPTTKLSVVGFILDIIPTTVVDAFAEGHILQIMLFSVLFGLGLLKVGDKGRKLVELFDQASATLFAVLRFIMVLAPVGTFGAMAFTVGAYGIGTLMPLAKVVATVYAGCILFTLVVLGSVARLAGFRILKFLAYIKEEILIVLATSTSEVALPPLMKKLEQAGCHRSVVGLVTPTGYSFNQDGGAVYQVVSTLFIAQAMNVDLGWIQLLTFMLVLQVTSKGGAGVSGSAFVVLAATLASLQTVPVAGMALLLGVERFMSMARATMNVIGNGVATLVVARWDGALDIAQMQRELGLTRKTGAASAE